MKKIIASLVGFLALAGSLFAEVPVFDKNPNAYIIDKQELNGELKDNVEVVNVSTATNFEVTVYGWHEIRKEWLEFGKSRLYGIGDKQKIRPIDRYNRSLQTFRYFAIDTSANVKFKCSSVAANKDLHIWFYDDREIDTSHNKVFDLTLLPSFSDNLKLVAGKNFNIGASFTIEVYNDDSESPKAGTVAILKGAKDTDTYSKTNTGKKYSDFHYLRIISREEKDFKYTANVNHNDLIITVNE